MVDLHSRNLLELSALDNPYILLTDGIVRDYIHEVAHDERTSTTVMYHLRRIRLERSLLVTGARPYFYGVRVEQV